MVGPWHFTTFSLRNDIRMMFAQRLEELYESDRHRNPETNQIFVRFCIGWMTTV